MPPSLDRSSDTAALKAYRDALRTVRPRWQTLVFLFSGLIGSFLLPAILLCGWVSQQHIVWAITATALNTGVGYLWVSWTVECRTPERQRVDDLLLSGILLIAAALLMVQIAVQTGPMQQRTLGFWLSATTGIIAALAGAHLMHRRALRLVSRRHGGVGMPL
jgi:hypothetical protein